MNQHEAEIYNFFTTEANFANMYNVSKHYEKIKPKLLSDFWKAVEDKLIDKISALPNKGWYTKRQEKLDSNVSKLFLYKSNWANKDNYPVIAFAYESLTGNPFYGLFINRGEHKIYNLEEISASARRLVVRSDNTSNNWWSFFYYSSLNFNKLESLVKILPANRDVLVQSFADELFNLALKHQLELDNIILANKKQTT